MAFNRRKQNLQTAATGQLAPVSGGVPSTPVDLVFMTGSFLTNGASAPIPFAGVHPFSVVRTSAGLFTITLGGLTVAAGGYSVRKIAAFLPVLGKTAAGSALRAAPGIILENLTSATPTTLQVRLEDAAGAATDLAAATDNRVNFMIAFLTGGR